MICVLPGQVKANNMRIPYQALEKITINQVSRDSGATRVATADLAVVLLPARPARIRWSALPDGRRLKARLERAPDDELLTETAGREASRLLLARVPVETDAFRRLDRARQLLARGLLAQDRRLLIDTRLLPEAAAPGWAEALVSAALARAAPLPSFKREPPAQPALRRIDLAGARAPDLALARAAALGNQLTRWLARLPGNELTPGRYRRLAEDLARHEGFSTRFLGEAALERLGAGAFLAVSRASERRDAGILQLRYRPPGGGRRPALALVGKGICFDTGGVNLKSARYMQGMHEDMTGSAVALGTLLALGRLRFPLAVDCWLALAENHLGPRAYKPGDVIRACDKTSIEIVHTDAEGRMVLADTLALASRTRPRLILDFATLTGACVQALSTRYSGALTNRGALNPVIGAAGRDSGERVWPFPMDEDYDQALESDIADIRQCTLDSEADHILAARFLGRFVGPDTAWIHLDLSASRHKGGLAHVPTDSTGFGVRFALHLLQKREIRRLLETETP